MEPTPESLEKAENAGKHFRNLMIFLFSPIKAKSPGAKRVMGIAYALILFFIFNAGVVGDMTAYNAFWSSLTTYLTANVFLRIFED